MGTSDTHMIPPQTPTPPAFRIENPQGKNRILLVCEHASPHIPGEYADLSMSAETRASHAAWDIGATRLASLLAQALDAPLVAATVSRLVIDLNRRLEAPSLIVAETDGFFVPGNRDLSDSEKQDRIARFHVPFHATIAHRMTAHQPDLLLTIHSFTPVFKGYSRAVEIGIVHDDDPRFANALHPLLQPGPFDVRVNEPYGPEDDATYTLHRHGVGQGCPNAMIEIRNDLLGNEAAIAHMAGYLSPHIQQAVQSLKSG
ncbi:MAG: N-formylglutamate amidohydrolase [Magnetospiraceae bacterium]